MKRLSLIACLSTATGYAGTPDNSDISYFYGFFILILLIMLCVDGIRLYLKKRKEAREQDLYLNESESPIDSNS